MHRPEIILIAAIAEKNRVIGKDGKLPWHISEDLKRFKRLTVGHTVIMGRKTFDSIIARLGKPLPERRNIVLTRSKSYPDYPEVETFADFDAALEAASDASKVFIIGGERVFRDALRLAHRLELTLVEGDYDGDAYFPEYRELLEKEFKSVKSEQRDGYRFETFVRV